jgi:hypothetical protein
VRAGDIGGAGITSVRVIGDHASNGERLLISYVDGSVAVFDYITRRCTYLTRSAHSETIFDCK